MTGIKATLGVLIQERAALDAAISVLQRFDVTESAAPKAPHRKRRKRAPMSAERRKEIGAAVRAAHAKRRAENNGDAVIPAPLMELASA